MIEIIDALKNWGIPATVISIIVGCFILIQIIGEIIELCGKTVPVFCKVRKLITKYIEYRKKKAGQYARMETTLAAVNIQQQDVKKALDEMNKHYDTDNIAKRDKWMLDVNTKMKWVDERAKVYDASVKELNAIIEVVKKQSENIEKQQQALDMNNKMTSEMYKQSCRRDILDFEHKIINARRADKPLVISREEFRKIRKTYDGYEAFLDTFGGTNGEVDDAIEVIRRAEHGEYPYIEFLEDIRD